MRLKRALVAITAVLALLFGTGAITACSSSSKSGHSSGSTAHAAPPSDAGGYSACAPGDDSYSWCSHSATPAAGGVGGAPAPTGDGNPTPGEPHAPAPPEMNYSTGGDDCLFYAHPGPSAISLSQDGKTLYGEVQVLCDPYPQLIVVHVALYFFGDQSTHWEQLATGSFSYSPAKPYRDNSVAHAEWTCKSGFWVVVMNATGTSYSGNGFTAASTSQPLYILPGRTEPGSCKPMSPSA